MPISIEPEELDTEKTNIEGVITDFQTLLDDRQTAIEALSWEGDAPAAFESMFQQAKTAFETHVEGNITAIADMLQGIRDGMVERDEDIATAIESAAP